MSSPHDPTPALALAAALAQLSAAEEFFRYFDLEFDQRALDINRLHILKRYQQYLRRDEALTTLDADALRARHREHLACAYEDFLHSNAVAEKVFKVFHQARGQQHVPLDTLRARAREGV